MLTWVELGSKFREGLCLEKFKIDELGGSTTLGLEHQGN